MSVIRTRAQVLAYALVAAAALGSMALPSTSLASETDGGCTVACRFCRCVQGSQLVCECSDCTIDCAEAQ